MNISYVMINVELGAEQQVFGEIRKIAGVKECHRVYGLYDIIVKVEADSMNQLSQVITSKIRQLNGVRSTLTTIVIE